MTTAEFRSGTHFINVFFIIIQIRSKLCTLTSILAVIATKFCTYNVSTAVVACAKFYGDLMAMNGITVKQVFRQIWIAMEKYVIETGPRLGALKGHPIASYLVSWASYGVCVGLDHLGEK